MNKFDNHKINYLVGNKSIKKIILEQPFRIFSEKIINFFIKISEDIMKHKDINLYPDLASFAFFCREKNLSNLKKEHTEHISKRCGRGVALHFTPSNVPMNFAYSLLFSLISGNVTLIRIGKNNYPQVLTLLKLINKRLNTNKFKLIKKKIIIFNYEKNIDINNFLSKNCEIRVIWGGDESINEIRNSKISSYAYELTFPDRYSLCVISSKEYLEARNFIMEAKNFYNDTLTFDQNACTSPRLIIWSGEKKYNDKARKIFWMNFNKIIKSKNYNFRDGTILQKLKSQYSAALELDGINSSIFKKQQIKSSLVKNFPKNLDNFTAPGGFFLEYYSKNLKNLNKYISIKIQTITTIGFSTKDVARQLKILNKKGVFRIVLNGQSSDMGLVWDGYEMIFQMSKKIIF